MTDCYDSTMLRAHLDLADRELERHLDECETCAGLLRAVAADAGYARSRLALLAPAVARPVDVAAALAAVEARDPATPVDRPVPVGPTRSPRLRRLWWAAAASLVAVTAVTPAGHAAIAATLDVFRGERFQVLSIDLEEWTTQPVYEGLRALRAVGDVDLTGLNEPTDVAGVGRAAEIAGLGAPRLPRPPDDVVAMAPGTVRVVLEARDGNGVPAELDGAALIVEVPGVLVAAFEDGDGSTEYVIGRTSTVTMRAEGAPLDDVRSFLLSREELPEQLRSQLAGIDDWRTTIPLPVPVDGPPWREVEVAGRPAVVFGDDSGIAALVLRSDPDGITVVGGRIAVDRALALAADA
jgi:hypothetical protein